MFQVAHGFALARKRGVRAKFVDFTMVAGRVDRVFEVACFNVQPVYLSKWKKKLLQLRIILSKRLQKINPMLHLDVLVEDIKNQVDGLDQICSVCSGYWQNEKHFINEIDDIQVLFSFPVQVVPKTLMSLSDDPMSVAVHIRRGDYISDPIARASHYVCDTEWYQRAMDEVRALLKNPRFYIFSDDKSWASSFCQNIKDAIFVNTSTDSPAWLDMALMSKCSNFIISNSSYSWWASYLGKTGDSIVIAPKYWFPDVLTVESGLMCEGWTIL